MSKSRDNSENSDLQGYLTIRADLLQLGVDIRIQ